MGAVIAFVLQHKSLIIIALLALALAGSSVYIKVLKGEVAKCEAQKETLKAELDVSQASVKSLQESIAEQNLAVEKIKSAADERQKANAAELAKAQANASTFKKKAQDLMKVQAPQSLSRCDAANMLFNQEIINGK